METMEEMFIQTNNTNPIFFMPYLRHVFRKKYRMFKESSKLVEDFILVEINEHLTAYQDGHVGDFQDAFLCEMFKKERNGEKSTSFHSIGFLCAIVVFFYTLRCVIRSFYNLIEIFLV